MGSASKCFLSLILISFTFFLFNSPLLSISCNLKISIIHNPSRFRSLLDLKNPNFVIRKTHNSAAFPPSPAPIQEIQTPFHPTKFHAKNTPHSPPLSHHQSISNEKHGTKKKKKNSSTIIISICACLLLLVIIFTIFSTILCKKSKRHKNKKVNFDPGPELFYLNSLTHCIDIHETNHEKIPSDPLLEERIIVASSPIFQNRDSTNFSEEETRSFHSARVSELSDLSQNHLPSNCSSYGSNILDRVSDNVSVEPIEVNDPHELHFPAISSPRISFLGHTLKSFPSKNFPISKSAVESHIPNSPEVHLHVIPSRSRSPFPGNRNAGHSCNNSSKSQDFPESQVLNDFPRNKKTVTFSRVALESPNCSEYQVQNYPLKNTSIPSKPCTKISDILAPLSKNGNIPKPPPPPPPPPPPMKQSWHQRPYNNGKFVTGQTSPIKILSPVGKDENTLPKLKPLHWDKVRAAPDRAMVWDQIGSSTFEVDEEMIESLFGYKSKSVLTEETNSKTTSPCKNLLDHKRLQNITILLKALNATPDQICLAICKGNGLSVQQLEALVKMTPTTDEEENISNYQGDIEELDSAEKFVKMVLSVPFAFAKIEMMLYKETFGDEISHLRNSFVMLEEACKELKSSNLFLRLLEAVLKTGNRMNVGTTRGGARAFKLDALLKLADVKGTDGKTTLLHFVIQEMNKPKPDERDNNKPKRELTDLDLVSDLCIELSNVKKTASVDLDVLIGSIENLSLGLSKIKQLIQDDLCVGDSNLRFSQSMWVFMQNAERVIEELKNEEKEVLIHVREITEYYHGELSKEETNPLRIFVIVRDFLAMLDRACKELRKPKINQTGPQLVMLTR